MVSRTIAPQAYESDDPKLRAAVELLRKRFGRPERVLVVGCGDGTEAAFLADLLGTDVVGVDIEDAFHPAARDRVQLVAADARELPFSDGSFDVVFSFHTLEHVPGPERAIAEMRRVVSATGGFWVGTPNRARLIGYLGSRDASSREKLAWNLADWRARLSGRFRNEFGAHAGFTRRELAELLAARFEVVEDETSSYYAALYPGHARLLSVLERSRLARFAYPAVYFAGRP